LDVAARADDVSSLGYPSNVFAHNSTVDPDVLSELSVGSSVNFKIRFNRAGPVAVDIKLGRSNSNNQVQELSLGS
jgi:cold shock CspA family protein